MSRLLFNAKALLSWIRAKPVFDLPYYREAELARLANLFAHVDLEAWRGKKVLEVGAGFGRLGAALSEMGLDVTSSDGRPQQVERMKREGRSAFVLDLDEKGIDGAGDFDIVLAFGVLYHLSKPAQFLASCGRNADILLLETAVTDLSAPELPMVAEHSKGWRGQDQALNTTGCRPSPAWVEQECERAGFDVARDISSAIGNWEIGHFDWQPRNDGKSRRGRANLRKMWVFEKRAP